MSGPGAKRKEKTMRRKEKGARKYGKLRISKARREVPNPSRNLDKERDRPVTVADIKPHALDGHPACKGTGLTSKQMVCSCAMKRFLKAHPEIIIDVPDADHPERAAVFWPKKDDELENA